VKLEEALVAVWRQALEENANIIELEGQRYPVRRTARRRLRQVDFSFGGQPLRGIEQNPETASHWAKLAREGHRVMQFTAGGRYIANVVDGRVTSYQRTAPKKSTTK
jgi:hypothetical protein